MSDWITSDAGVDVHEDWLTGHPDEDALTLSGRCPWQTGFGGWGDPYGLCEASRSDDEGDWPYCRSHAARIRDERGHGGYVG